jgi:hypothetical protein
VNAITECNFLHCEAEKPLIIISNHFGREWGLCPFHEKLVEKNGASIEVEGGREFLFSPVMIRGKSE